ncbi:MAG: hypothetical protein A4E53_01811 [Pelotomaculum sp. PtaB.Bin104]|nr:MAG: hypothetical protein A4E53_01811 [Pelotomaculum sp. PtaB.Bin104]
MLGGAVTVGEPAAGLNDNIYTMVAPGNRPRFRYCEGFYIFAVNPEFSLLIGIYIRIKKTMHRIVLQQMSHGTGVSQVVYGHYFKVRVIHRRAKYRSADTAKAVNAYSYSQVRSSFIKYFPIKLEKTMLLVPCGVQI